MERGEKGEKRTRQKPPDGRDERKKRKRIREKRKETLGLEIFGSIGLDEAYREKRMDEQKNKYKKKDT